MTHILILRDGKLIESEINFDRGSLWIYRLNLEKMKINQELDLIKILEKKGNTKNINQSDKLRNGSIIYES